MLLIKAVKITYIVKCLIRKKKTKKVKGVKRVFESCDIEPLKICRQEKPDKSD